MIDDLLERAEKFVKKRLKNRRKNRSSASGYSGRFGYGAGSGRGRGRDHDNHRGSQELIRAVLTRLAGRPDRRGHGIHRAFSGGHDPDRRWRNDFPYGSGRNKRRRKGFDLD